MIILMQIEPLCDRQSIAHFRRSNPSSDPNCSNARTELLKEEYECVRHLLDKACKTDEH